jgi:hypothetical protein
VTIAKVRGLSQSGVITDVDPFNLPPTAFSRGVNVRFHKGSVERAPVFRRLPATLSRPSPRFLTSNLPTSGFDTLYLGYLDGRVYSFRNGTQTNVSVFGYVDNSSELGWTSCHLGDVFYVNRGDRVPWSLRTSDSVFQTLAHWDTNWKTKILRSCGGALCAFNITGGGGTPSISGSFPTMVLTSEFAQAGAVPSSWDFSDVNSNATQNILGEMEGAIIDATNFGSGMIIYGQREAWGMNADGSNNIWDYRKLPFAKGAMNVNCSVEVDGYHYVFGLDDIWRHDGVSEESICEQVRTYIFDNINLQLANRCFVYHDKARKEIRFFYSSGDDLCGFLYVDGTNRCAVYDLVEGTWTFDDLPYVYGAASSNVDTTLTYATVTQTYDTIGGSYLDQEDSLKKITVFFGDVSTVYNLSTSLYAVDQQGIGSKVPYVVDTNATLGWTLVRDGLDVDDLPEVEDNRGYKVISRVLPQARLEAAAQPISFQVGGANNYNDAVVYSDAQTYDGDVFTSIDANIAGRFLSLRITHDDYHWVKLTGFDIEFEVTGYV